MYDNPPTGTVALPELAEPAVNVTGAEVEPSPVQVLLPLYRVRVTEPVGLPLEPVTLATSWTVDPIGAEVTMPLALCTSVATVGVSFVEVSGSQGPSPDL